MKKLIVPICAVAAAATFCAYAQDMGEDVEEQPALAAEDALAVAAEEESDEEPAAEEAPAPQQESAPAAPVAEAATVTPAASDPGPAIVVQAQQWEQVAQPKAQTKRVQNASEMVQKSLAKNKMRQGFVPGSRAIIQIGVANDTVKDIKNSASFMKLREGLAREATLNARAKIAKALRQKMSAGEKIIESDSQEFDKYKAKHAEEFAELERQKEKVATLLKKVDQAEAATLEGRTREDDWDAIVAGIIKKIDDSYDPNKVAADKKARFAEMKEAYTAAKKQLDALKTAYESDPIGKNISDVKACFDLDMYGVNIIFQAESYDETDGTYQIACAAVWSPKLQQRAILALNGGKIDADKLGKMSLEDWLESKAAEDEYGSCALASMVGPRQYVDDQGRQHFLGFAACILPSNARNRQREMEKADLEAEKIVLSSLYQETSGSQEKHDELLMYAGTDDAQRETDALGSYAKILAGKTPERPVSGIVKAYSVETLHPFTDRKIYVTVAGVDSELAFEAEGLLEEIHSAAVQDAIRTDYTRGKEAARKEIVDRARKSGEAYQQGKKDAAASLQAILKDAAGVKDEVVAPDQAPAAPKAPRQRPTVISGDDEIEADF